MYALVQDGAIVEFGNLPRIWTDASGEDHDWRRPPYRTEPADQGWLPIVVEPRPAGTAATIPTQNPPAFVGGVPTITWSLRAKTAEELAADQAAAEREATRTAVRAIITDLQAEKARAQAVIDKSNNQVSGADTKDVARAAKRVADAAIDLARFVRDM